jgi:hypothetical protein
MVCEAFGCVPSVARRELLEANPNGYLWRILELRGYRDTKRAIDRAKKPEDEPQGPLAALVNETAFRLAQRRYDERNAEAE